MFVASNFILAIARLVHLILEAYFWIIIARSVLSWVSPDPFNPIVRFLFRITEPVLRPIRRRLPIMMGFDVSPVVVLVGLRFTDWFLVDSLHDLAISLR